MGACRVVRLGAPLATLLIAAGFYGAAFCSCAYAHDERLPRPESVLGGVVQERDVGLLFGYLREAIGAAIEGREAPSPSGEIAQRAEEIGGEVRRRGAVVAREWVDAIEKRVREGLREPAPRPALPPSNAYQRI